MVTIAEGNKTVQYKHIIEPINKNGTFVPNWDELTEVVATSQINILSEHFEKYQKQGKTILVNFAGGWCTLTKEMQILSK